MVGHLQTFALTAGIAAPLPPVYQAVASSLGWSLFQWGNPFPSGANAGGPGTQPNSRRRRLRRRQLLDDGSLGVGPLTVALANTTELELSCKPTINNANFVTSIVCGRLGKSSGTDAGGVPDYVKQGAIARWDDFTQIVFWEAVTFVSLIVLHLALFFFIWPRLVAPWLTRNALAQAGFLQLSYNLKQDFGMDLSIQPAFLRWLSWELTAAVAALPGMAKACGQVISTGSPAGVAAGVILFVALPMGLWCLCTWQLTQIWHHAVFVVREKKPKKVLGGDQEGREQERVQPSGLDGLSTELQSVGAFAPTNPAADDYKGNGDGDDGEKEEGPDFEDVDFATVAHFQSRTHPSLAISGFPIDLAGSPILFGDYSRRHHALRFSHLHGHGPSASQRTRAYPTDDRVLRLQDAMPASLASGLPGKPAIPSLSLFAEEEGKWLPKTEASKEWLSTWSFLIGEHKGRPCVAVEDAAAAEGELVIKPAGPGYLYLRKYLYSVQIAHAILIAVLLGLPLDATATDLYNGGLAWAPRQLIVCLCSTALKTLFLAVFSPIKNTLTFSAELISSICEVAMFSAAGEFCSFFRLLLSYLLCFFPSSLSSSLHRSLIVSPISLLSLFPFLP